jgi:hypothetical protein
MLKEIFAVFNIQDVGPPNQLVGEEHELTFGPELYLAIVSVFALLRKMSTNNVTNSEQLFEHAPFLVDCHRWAAGRGHASRPTSSTVATPCLTRAHGRYKEIDARGKVKCKRLYFSAAETIRELFQGK